MKSKFLVWVIALLIAVFCQSPLLAQNETVPPPVDQQADQSADEEILNYTLGNVVSASADQITITELVFVGEEEKEQQSLYTINGETVLDNIKAIADVVANDEVEIYYVEGNGAKIARWIMKVEPEDATNVFEEDVFPELDESYDESGTSTNAIEMEAPLNQTAP